MSAIGSVGSADALAAQYVRPANPQQKQQDVGTADQDSGAASSSNGTSSTTGTTTLNVLA